ncbi:MAG: hypothetical protein R3250_17480, partial [Melioribacteraceae bacterium]|nr:hypothetical protein [Melioribacteraceae bacterium]
MLSLDNYSQKSWGERFPDEIDVTKLKVHSSWKNLFDDNKELLQKVNVSLNKVKKKDNLFPHPNLLFNAFNKTPLKKVKVVILGQDPYHGCVEHKGRTVPQAMGLSFSVPKGM